MTGVAKGISGYSSTVSLSGVKLKAAGKTAVDLENTKLTIKKGTSITASGQGATGIVLSGVLGSPLTMNAGTVNASGKESVALAVGTSKATL